MDAALPDHAATKEAAASTSTQVWALLHTVSYKLFGTVSTSSAAVTVSVTHRECEVVKHLSAVPPAVCIAVLALTLVVEAIHLQSTTIQQSDQQYC
jgi:hypothetical protein